MSLCMGIGTARAQALAEVAAVPAPASETASSPMPPLIGLDGHERGDGPYGRAAALLSYRGGARQDESLPLLSVVTLPPELRPGRPPARSHHALSLRSDGSTRALRSMGFDVTDCATRFRFPSRFRQSSANSDGGFEAVAQISWLCRF